MLIPYRQLSYAVMDCFTWKVRFMEVSKSDRLFKKPALPPHM